MAAIDYGVIALKDNEYTGRYDIPFQSLPQWVSDHFKNNTWSAVGNEDVSIGFYKEHIHWWVKGDKEIHKEYLNCSDYYGWTLWSKTLLMPDKSSQVFLNIDVVPKNGYYVAKFKLDGNQYKVFFGYGVDYSYWNKTGRVNYYRSMGYLFKKLKCRLFRK